MYFWCPAVVFGRQIKSNQLGYGVGKHPILHTQIDMLMVNKYVCFILDFTQSEAGQQTMELLKNALL